MCDRRLSYNQRRLLIQLWRRFSFLWLWEISVMDLNYDETRIGRLLIEIVVL